MPYPKRLQARDHSEFLLSKTTERGLMAAAYFTTAAVYTVVIVREPDLRQPPTWITLTILFVVFAFALHLEAPARAPLWQREGLLLLKVILVSVIVFVGQGVGYLPILYFIVAPMAYFSLTFRQASGVTLLCFVMLFLVYLLLGYQGIGTVVALLLPYGGGLLFFAALTTALIRQREERRRAEQLLAELEDAHRQLRDYATQVKALAVAEERNRLAREIHDSLGHYLTAITIQLEAAGKLVAGQPERASESIAKAEEMARESLAEVRRSVAALRASPLDTVSLGDAVGELVGNLHDSGIATTFTVKGKTQSLPIQAKTALYRVAQEGLTNVHKHANASAVEVTLAYQSEQVMLTIEDNGTGQRGGEAEGFGLPGLRERIALVGGSLEAGDRPEGGFRLHAAVPRQVQEDE